MKVERWIGYDHPEIESLRDVGTMGGFFQDGMRWLDYLAQFNPDYWPYAEALRAEILRRELRECGDWAQQTEGDGIPVFSDGSIATYSFRAWGDLLAAVWSEHEQRDYCYMNFYMSCWGQRYQ